MIQKNVSQPRLLPTDSFWKVTISVSKLNQPAFIRALVSKDGQQTKVEWTRDSAWRFLPVQKDEKFGYVLHPIDLAINKVLALAGPR